MPTFTPDGQYVLVANEGDPEGSISVIAMGNGVANLTQADVRTADFSSFT